MGTPFMMTNKSYFFVLKDNGRVRRFRDQTVPEAVAQRLKETFAK